MYSRVVILLAAFFLLTNCQQDSLNEAMPTSGDNTEVDARRAFPELLPLPNGFSPEGIVAGDGTDFYVGSLGSGDIYKGDLRTGGGEVFFTDGGFPQAVGLAFDQRTKYLYVAGGGSGTALVIDTRTGGKVASFDFSGAFVNDVIVTRNAAYFTDSFTPNLYKVPLSSTGSPEGASFEVLALSGDFIFIPGNFNSNGIEALPNGRALIVVNSGVGELYRVDPGTGEASLIDLGGEAVPSGDGILLAGKTLYVVQNFLNQIAVVELAPDYLSGSIEGTLTDDDFRIPTTVTRHGGTLYAVNARFDVAPPGTPNDLEFNVVKVGE